MLMGHQLKKFDLGNGQLAEEKACMNYVCRYCGAKAAAANFVANMCLQVYARHQGLCGAYVNSEKYSGYITECSSCKYFVKNMCTCEEV